MVAGLVRCSAVLFDLDGVLVDSTSAIERAWRRWALLRGLDTERVLRLARDGHGADHTIRVASPTLSPDQVASEVNLVLQLQIDDDIGLRPIRGARPLLDTLPSHCWAVVTGCNRELAVVRLRGAGLPVPEILVTTDDVSVGKPDPLGFRMAASALGATPGDCLVIEDSPAGVLAAVRGRTKLIGLRTTHSGAELNRAELQADDLRCLCVLEASDGKIVIELRDPVGRCSV